MANKIPLKLQKAVQRLVTPNIRMRPRVLPLLKCPVFDVPYIHAMDFLDTMSVKPAEEKIRFIQNLPELLGRDVLGRDVAIYKVMPVLVGAVTTIAGTEGAMQQDVNRREGKLLLQSVKDLFESCEDTNQPRSGSLTGILRCPWRFRFAKVAGIIIT